MRNDRFIVGIVCLASAAWILLVRANVETVAPAIVLVVLGIWGLATSRKSQATVYSVKSPPCYMW